MMERAGNVFHRKRLSLQKIEHPRRGLSLLKRRTQIFCPLSTKTALSPRSPLETRRHATTLSSGTLKRATILRTSTSDVRAPEAAIRSKVGDET